ncbi:MAG: hypothetical protein AB1758_04530, partial [Candidatus Eremiobacterota bacterium]
MNWGLLRILLTHELKMVFRDGRTIVLSVLLPLLLVPLVLSAMGMISARRQELQSGATYQYCLDPPGSRVRTIVREAVQLGDPDEKPVPGTRLRRLHFQETMT